MPKVDAKKVEQITIRVAMTIRQMLYSAAVMIFFGSNDSDVMLLNISLWTFKVCL